MTIVLHLISLCSIFCDTQYSPAIKCLLYNILCVISNRVVPPSSQEHSCRTLLQKNVTKRSRYSVTRRPAASPLIHPHRTHYKQWGSLIPQCQGSLVDSQWVWCLSLCKKVIIRAAASGRKKTGPSESPCKTPAYGCLEV